MTDMDIEQMLDEIGVPYAFHHFTVEEAIEPPFLVWNTPGSNNFGADGKVYFKVSQLDLELYADAEIEPLEEQVETVLDARGIFYQKSKTYLDDELMFETLYEMEV